MPRKKATPQPEPVRCRCARNVRCAHRTPAPPPAPAVEDTPSQEGNDADAD